MASRMTPPPRICVRPGCGEIVPPPPDGGEFPLYHSKECRSLARKERRTAKQKLAASPPGPAAGRTGCGEPAAGRPGPAVLTQPVGPRHQAGRGRGPAVAAAPEEDGRSSLGPALRAGPVAALRPGRGVPLVRPRVSSAGGRGRPAAVRHRGLAVAGYATGLAVLLGTLTVLSPRPGRPPGPLGLDGRPSHPAPASTQAPVAVPTVRPAATSAVTSAAEGPRPPRPHSRPPARTTRPASPGAVPAPASSPSSPPVAQVSPVPPPAVAAPPRPARFAALAGPGCPDGGRVGTVAVNGWYYQPGGGWAGDGCSGAFVNKWVHQPGAYPLSTFTWWFHTGLPGRAACRVSVYVPEGSGTAVGASPAQYTVFTGSGGSAGTFAIDQQDYHGDWVREGSFPARGGVLSVQVDNIGGGSLEVAADALRISCTAR
jgi:hypothetical protein